MSQDKRPISPFMLGTKGQLAKENSGKGYKFQITSVMSFLHRLSGISLVFILIIVGAWLMTLASGPKAFEAMKAFITYPLIIPVVILGVFAACYHFCNGIRHLFWDMGKGLTIPEAKKSARIVQIIAPIIAVILLLIGFIS